MKKSLIALVIGVAALGFAQNAQATYTAEVSGTLNGSVSSTDMNGFMSAYGEGGIEARAGNIGIMSDDQEIWDTAYNNYGEVQIMPADNYLMLDFTANGAGTVAGSASTNSFGKSSDTNLTTASTSGASLSAINGNDGTGIDLTVNVSSISAIGSVHAAPALGALSGIEAAASSEAFILPE